ncbi:flagellar basal body-associated protein FliL [Zobellella maritima]|uniref:flagellar basal body-associated protein FliL n=1 Tax=Zobellella maritima TaxID=2059725 RepID=UPI000E308BBC|nr:flagellar basal body-associated protein FliL [Zobellella maritima]
MADAKGKGKTKWLIALMVLIMVAVTGVNAYFLLQNLNNAQTGTDTAENKAAKRAAEPIFVKIAPFTVNLQPDRYGPRLLYTGLTLLVGNSDTEAQLASHMPQVRNRLLLLLSGQQADTLTSASGKQQLAQSILEQLRRPMTDAQPELLIDDVLFTEFIVQ